MMIWQKWNKADKTLLAAAVVFAFALCLNIQYKGNVFAAGFLFCAEAALVGGIADWFAVTALFEKPLGFPWHTAILPRRRQSFIEATGRMLQKEFFGKKVLLAKVKKVNFAARLLAWLAEDANKDMLAGWLAARGEKWLKAHDDLLSDRLGGHLKELAGTDVPSEKVRNFLLYGVRRLEEGAQRPEFADRIRDGLEAYIESRLQGPMAMMMAGFAQSVNMINTEEAAGLIRDKCLLFLSRVQEEESEEAGQLMLAAEKFLQFLQKNFAAKQELDNVLLNSVKRLNLSEYLFNTTDEANGADAPDVRMKELSRGMIEVVYGMLLENGSLQAELNGICYQLTARGAMQAQEMLGNIAGDVLGTMTDEQINRLIYDKAEPDLLWIRMNGSIVGAAIGLAIFAIMQLI
ncbi:DUF445 family protein [Anaerovibrio sp.]|uniref:DUF445 family protein n=1 Tax=Anaerovibrio sp. TaxID=1872532 RepID=UPI003F18AA99